MLSPKINEEFKIKRMSHSSIRSITSNLILKESIKNNKKNKRPSTSLLYSQSNIYKIIRVMYVQ